VRLAAAGVAIRDHPRHAMLFALAAGLLTGPVSPTATIAAAALAAALVALARAAPPARAVAAPRSLHPLGPPAPRPSLASRGSLPPVVPFAAAVAVLAGAVVADVRVRALEGGPLPQMHGRWIEARAVLLEPVRVRPRGPAVARARLPGLGDAVLRLRDTARLRAWPGVGEIVAVGGRIAPLGRFDEYQRRRGAAAALEVYRFAATGDRRGGPLAAVDAARRRAEAALTRRLAAPEAALLRGMVLGQDERLSEDVRDDFKRSGLAHVLAVSGQNVMLLAILVLAAGAVAGIGLRARLLIALALVAFYVPLTGAGPSIQRAGVMGAAGLVAALAGRPSHRWYALGLAAAVTLALNPRAAGEPGWQLSFAAVVALLALGPPLRETLTRALPGPVADVAAITIAATLGTAPLMAMHFGQVSLAALPANLLAAAAIAPIMWLGMLAAAAGQAAPALATPFNVVNGPLLVAVQWIAHAMANAPAAVLPVRLGSPAALAAAYVALAGALLALRAAWRRARHAGQRGRAARTRRAVVLVAVVPAGFAVFTTATAERTIDSPRRGELVVSFLDVGQGDATLLRRDGVAVLVDTGPPGGPILERLAEAGVRRLDALVITHAQADHEGAALELLRRVPTRLVVNGGAGWPTAVQRGLARATGARTLAAHAGQVLTLGRITMRLLWPPPPGPDFRPQGDPNDRALVALVESGDFDLLLPADAESDVTASIPFPDVDALKVAHHGSDDPGLPALLERIRPEFAAIEVGEENTYGHPTPATLKALEAVDHVYRTDRDGTVHLRFERGRVAVERSP
jgi:competence protein ComEC